MVETIGDSDESAITYRRDISPDDVDDPTSCGGFLCLGKIDHSCSMAAMLENQALHGGLDYGPLIDPDSIQQLIDRSEEVKPYCVEQQDLEEAQSTLKQNLPAEKPLRL
jgi:hypothetical protein